MRKLSRNEMVDIVRQIKDPEILAERSEEELSELYRIFSENSIHPRAMDMIFWPEPGEEDLSPEEIVEKAMNYRPIQL